VGEDLEAWDNEASWRLIFGCPDGGDAKFSARE
jgi:hypothetical protein